MQAQWGYTPSNYDTVLFHACYLLAIISDTY